MNYEKKIKRGKKTIELRTQLENWKIPLFSRKRLGNDF